MQNGENRHGTERDKDDHNNLIPHRISIAMGGSIGRWGIRPPQLAGAAAFGGKAPRLRRVDEAVVDPERPIAAKAAYFVAQHNSRSSMW